MQNVPSNKETPKLVPVERPRSFFTMNHRILKCSQLVTRCAWAININDRNWRKTSCQEAGVTSGLVTAAVFSLRFSVFGKDSEAVEQ